VNDPQHEWTPGQARLLRSPMRSTLLGGLLGAGFGFVIGMALANVSRVGRWVTDWTIIGRTVGIFAALGAGRALFAWWRRRRRS